MEFEHDGHHVHLIELPTSSGRRWKFSVVVCCESEGIRRIRSLNCIGRAFETAHNARLEGIEFTKKWIDEGKPAQNQPMISMAFRFHGKHQLRFADSAVPRDSPQRPDHRY